MNEETIPIVHIDKIKNILKIQNKQQKKYCVVFFKMENCGYCKMFEPIFNSVKKLYEYDIVEFYTIYNNYSYGNENLIDVINELNSPNFKTLFIPGYPTIALFESDPEKKNYYYAETYNGNRELFGEYINNLVLSTEQ